jgi:hypothetical protein
VTTTPWIKATASGQSGDCVELRRHDDVVEVRDSKNPDGHAHQFTPSEFEAWLNGAKNGEFDSLA